MSPKEQRERIKGFLLKRTQIYNEIYLKVAKEKLELLSSRLGNCPQLDEYIAVHDEEISKEANKVLDDLCKEIIPEHEYAYMLKQVGIFSLFLLPPIYPLVRRIIHILDWPPIDYMELSICIVSVLLLLTMIFASAYTVFKISHTNNN